MLAGAKLEGDAATCATLSEKSEPVDATSNPQGLPSEGVGVARAVLVAAREIAHQSSFPGISEAATLASIMVGFFQDNRGMDSGGDARIRQCLSMVFTLQRATEVLGKVSFAVHRHSGTPAVCA